MNCLKYIENTESIYNSTVAYKIIFESIGME